MKAIKALIQPFMLEKVCHALEQIAGLPGLTVSEVIGFGKHRAQKAPDTLVEAGRRFARKTKIEPVVTDEMAPPVVEAIAKAAHTGHAEGGRSS